MISSFSIKFGLNTKTIVRDTYFISFGSTSGIASNASSKKILE